MPEESYDPTRDPPPYSPRHNPLNSPGSSRSTPTAELLEVVTILTRNQSRLRSSVDTLLDQQQELLELVDTVITRNEEVGSPFTQNKLISFSYLKQIGSLNTKNKFPAFNHIFQNSSPKRIPFKIALCRGLLGCALGFIMGRLIP